MNQDYICHMLHSFIENYFGKQHIHSIHALAQAGSNRKYYRVILNNQQSYIACENENIAENETFINFTSFFLAKGISVPNIMQVHPDKKHYIMEDLGNTCLLDSVLSNKDENQFIPFYEQSLLGLIKMQLEGGKGIDFTQCYAASQFDKNAVLADLNYFKYYFLDLHDMVYNKTQLQTEFDHLAHNIASIPNEYFMFRDFQGRNIMIKDHKPYFIDYQGGMRGPLQYDVASLLWQAKAALPFDLKESLYLYYKKQLSAQFVMDEKTFDQQYYSVLLIRLLQVLGAYGLRGIIEQRNHFTSSIPYGLQNIEEWITHYATAIDSYPTLQGILKQLCNESMKKKYPMAKSLNNKTLKVLVQSFSYKKGIPADESGNGGGFMFDCRGILNPGRFEAYKKLTGRDQPVIDFLENNTQMPTFIHYAKKMVAISVEDYMERGFEHLQISFGCTGGQHRSVYCTDAMAKMLREQYGVEVDVKHLIQDEKNWIN